MLGKDKRAPESDNGPQQRGTVENKAPKPAGVLPKHTQQLVILSVAVVMILIMWLSGGSKHTGKTAAASPAATAQAPDPASLQDFKQTIQNEQAETRQPISPSALHGLQSLGLAGDVPTGSAVTPPDGSAPAPGGAIGGTTREPQPDPVQEDKKKREYLSLFATNVAFSYRNRANEPSGGETTTGNAIDSQQAPASASRLEAQLHEAEAQLDPVDAPTAQAPLSPASTPQQPAPLQQPSRKTTDAPAPNRFNSWAGKQYVLFEGTILETLLINRLNGSFAGPVDCLVTNDIYSHDGQHVLIPAGSKVLGEAKKVEALGQQRLAVTFHRLVMPDGYSVDLDQLTGLSQIGETALHDKVNNHYVQIFGASLAIGILGGVAEAGTGNILTNSALDQARAGFGSSLANSSMQILDRFLNILPTVTIHEGSRVKIYLAGDLLLPDYAEHTMPPNL